MVAYLLHIRWSRVQTRLGNSLPLLALFSFPPGILVPQLGRDLLLQHPLQLTFTDGCNVRPDSSDGTVARTVATCNTRDARLRILQLSDVTPKLVSLSRHWGVGDEAGNLSCDTEVESSRNVCYNCTTLLIRGSNSGAVSQHVKPWIAV